MDDNKDAPKKDKKLTVLSNRTLRIEPFGANVSASRTYNRAERLAAAIHLITNHVGETEPVRAHARRISLHLLSTIVSLKDEMRSPDSTIFKKALGELRELVSAIRVLAVAGHVSTQNAEVLIEAIDETGNLLVSSQRTPLSDSIHLTSDELLGSGEPTDVKGQRRNVTTSSFPDSHVKDKSSCPVSSHSSHLNGDEKRERRGRIIGMLTNQGQLGIKDIAANLPEYSEKMIQRELKHLVEEGKVKKAGSKRWSTYTIA